MDRWKSIGGKSQRGEAKKWEGQRRERVRRKKMRVREKLGKSRFAAFFNLAKAAGAEPSGQMRDEKLQMSKTPRPLLEVDVFKKCTLSRREAHFQVKSVKNWRVRTTFWRSDVEKVYAVVARSTFGSQKCRKIGVLSLFWRSDVEKAHTD